MGKVTRRASARILHVGCNAMDSLRILTFREVLQKGGLEDKEWEIIKKRCERIKKDIAVIRKVANHMERESR